ncbi:MAG: hypothetical protein CML74_04340, partial [Rhodobiaceae bacterium]|nr:hypothetical protein [Rhodobiaceae bacterium]
MRDIYKKSKTVSEALDTRLTCRAFKSTEIKKEVIFDILDKARRAPSGGNLLALSSISKITSFFIS